MRKFLFTVAISMIIAAPAFAQSLNLDFPGLAERAEEVVDITIDSQMLRLASKFLSERDKDERAVRDVVQGLQGIYVRSYQFAEAGEYDRNLVERVKSQLGPSWKPFVTVRSKTKDNVTIYADMRGDRVNGLVIISFEPREFTVVNIVGPIDSERLASLEDHFGIPKIMKEKDRE